MCFTFSFHACTAHESWCLTRKTIFVHQPYYVDANRVGARLFGATMSGNVPGEQMVRVRAVGAAGGGFIPHLLTTGIETLYEVGKIACSTHFPLSLTFAFLSEIDHTSRKYISIILLCTQRARITLSSTDIAVPVAGCYHCDDSSIPQSTTDNERLSRQSCAGMLRPRL